MHNKLTAISMLVLLLLLFSIMFAYAESIPTRILNATYTIGTNTNEVLEIKKKMQKQGYFSAGAELSGNYNSLMVERVKMFQKDHGLSATGQIDRAFLNALYNVSTVSSVSFSDYLKQGKVPKKGDIVTFGKYEQDNKQANGAEPIEWIVVKTDGKECLLLSRYALSWASVESFTDSVALSQFNLSQIEKDHVVTPINSSYLLSETELDYLAEENRKCMPTEFAKKGFEDKLSADGFVRWFLNYRSVGKTYLAFKVVGSDGRSGRIEVASDSFHAQAMLKTKMAIRPAISVSFK